MTLHFDEILQSLHCMASKLWTPILFQFQSFRLAIFNLQCYFRFGEEKTSKSPYVCGCAEVKWRSCPVQKLDTFINNVTSTPILKVKKKIEQLPLSNGYPCISIFLSYHFTLTDKYQVSQNSFGR